MHSKAITYQLGNIQEAVFFSNSSYTEEKSKDKYLVGVQRYGFQGQEMDDEIKNSPGTSVNYRYRMHDPRVGRFFAVDPLEKIYSYNSPYVFSENRVVDWIELEGKQGARATPATYGMSPQQIYRQIRAKTIRTVRWSANSTRTNVRTETYNKSTVPKPRTNVRTSPSSNNKKASTGVSALPLREQELQRERERDNSNAKAFGGGAKSASNLLKHLNGDVALIEKTNADKHKSFSLEFSDNTDRMRYTNSMKEFGKTETAYKEQYFKNNPLPNKLNADGSNNSKYAQESKVYEIVYQLNKIKDIGLSPYQKLSSEIKSSKKTVKTTKVELQPTISSY